MKDEDIDLSDIPELTEDDFLRARPTAEIFRERGIPYPATSPIQVTIHKEDGTTERYQRKTDAERLTVTLDPDVASYFPDSESVNRVLRSLIALIPQKPSPPAD